MDRSIERSRRPPPSRCRRFEAIQQLLGEDAGERRIVYLFSDFRTRQWDKPDDLKKRLAQLDETTTPRSA